MTLSTALREELEHFIDTALENEEDYTPDEIAGLEALRPITELGEFEVPTGAAKTFLISFLNETEERIREDKETTSGRGAMNECRKHLIALGVYREISDAELNRMIVSGGRKYSFKLDGKKYIWNS
jgi:hypothetical protein